VAKLHKALASIRANGFAHTFGQRIKGAVGLFAPVFNASGEVIASFGVTVPEVRYRPTALASLTSSVVHQALALSRALGYLQPVVDARPSGSARRVRQ
jgi:DNA-binding IclR family transcriptional regulator